MASRACVIPIKQYSSRVPGKNFRNLNGKKLYEHIITNAVNASCFDTIYVDTDSEEIKKYARDLSLQVIDRMEWLASNQANGNDLLVYERSLHPNYDVYFQLFATAPFLRPETIAQCVDFLVNSQEYDSIFTATVERGWYWFGDMPVNYRPDVLPRSQDAKYLTKETTGLYGITTTSLEQYRCRIGRKPYIQLVERFEAIDLDTEEDFQYAEYLCSKGMIK